MSLQGPIPVEFGAVFRPGRTRLARSSRYETSTPPPEEKFVQSNDKASGLPLWVIEVIDPNPQARTRAVKVKVAAQVQPVIPGRAHPAEVAVRPGGVHRNDGHAVREPGRAAGLLGQGDRDPGARPRASPESREVAARGAAAGP